MIIGHVIKVYPLPWFTNSISHDDKAPNSPITKSSNVTLLGSLNLKFGSILVYDFVLFCTLVNSKDKNPY